MPAREMFFTFDKDVKANKKTVFEFVDEYRYYIDQNFEAIKKEFEVDSINTDFLKAFGLNTLEDLPKLKELKELGFSEAEESGFTLRIEMEDDPKQIDEENVSNE